MKRRPTSGRRLPAEEVWHPYEQLKLETVLRDTGEQISLDPFIVFAMLPARPKFKLRLPQALGKIRDLPVSPCAKHEPGPWTAALARVKPELVIGELVYCKRCGEQYKYLGPG